MLKISYIALLVVLIVSGFAPGAVKMNAREQDPNAVVFETATGKIKIRLITDRMVQVIHAPAQEFSERKRLSERDHLKCTGQYTVAQVGNAFIVKTSELQIKVKKNNGAISFCDLSGKPILMEIENGSRLTPANIPGDTAFMAYQKFHSPADEAIYGLGQYAYDIVNWKNSYLRMQQKNTAIASPVIVSTQGYGLFWHNYSRTEFNAELNQVELKSPDSNSALAEIKPRQTGYYTLVLEKENWLPVEMRVNDKIVYAHYSGVAYNPVVAKVLLEAGKTYKITIKNIARPIYPTIAAKYLIPADGKPGEQGLKGEYFDNLKLEGEPVLVRTDAQIDFNWEGGSFEKGFKTDAFSVRWSGKLKAARTMKNAIIEMTTDDGVRLFVNGDRVFESWRERGPETDQYRLDIEAGREYDIKIEYYENGGGASARFSWNVEPATGNMTFKNSLRLAYRSPEQSGTMSFKSDVADAIDYYFIYGPEPDSIISGIRHITGQAPLYPKWAYGLFMSQYGWDNQAKIQSVIDNYRRQHIPLDVVVQDMNYWPLEPANLWGSHRFDAKRYPDPAGMIDYIHHQSGHLIISVWPRINKGTDVYDFMNEKGYLLAVQQTSGNANEGIVIKDDSPNAAYDPFSEAGRQAYWKFMHDRLWTKGVDGWWMDASEPEWGYDFSQAHTALGSGRRYLNAYPLMSKKGVYEGQLATHSTKRPYVLTRSSFVGQQRYAATVWSGDIGPDWNTFRKQIPAGVNYCITGLPYWTVDIGGFVPYEFAGSPEYPELLVRWFQYGTFLPIMRVHGCRQTEFSNYDPTIQAILIDYTKLRYRLMPFIYSMGARVTLNDFNIHRALIMDFSADPQIREIQDQFMFGREFLVCPIVEKNAKQRLVYLPQTPGGWFDFWTGKKLAAGSTEKAEAPLHIVPLYVKAGSIVPMGPFMEYATERPADPLELRVYTGADGQFTLYEDENDNFNYQKGIFSQIQFAWDEQAQILTIGERQGEFPGMLRTRTIHIIWVSENHGVGLNIEIRADKIIGYQGEKLNVKR